MESMMPRTTAMWLLSLTLCLITFHNGAFAKKKICVIGAGRAGLAAIKIVADQSDDFEPIAFERNSDVGGLWIYTDSSDLDKHGLPVHSSIYKNLRTNLWKGLMQYPDYLIFDEEDYSNYMSHEEVLEYLGKYVDHFHLRKYIQFDTLVTKVFPIKGNGDWRRTEWHMETKNLNTNKKKAIICDGVMVCNGHLSKPKIPKIPGLESFPGRVLHSRSYRRPEDFTNQTVIVLGAGDSGIDIARDLNEHAKLVYLSHRHEVDPYAGGDPPGNVKVVRGIVVVDGSKVILQDSSTLVADAIIFCTGYLVDFPFLDARSGIVIEKNEVQPLYDDSINLKNPSMSFIGLLEDAIFGGTCYSQSEYFLDLLQGKQQLPSEFQHIACRR